jgi:signal transduction histidine kinase
MLHNPAETLLFPRLPADLIEKFRSVGTEESFANEQVIFYEGQADYDLHIVLEGRLRISKMISGTPVVLTVHEPGEFTGDIMLLMCEQTPVTGEAIGPTRTLRVPASEIRKMVADCSPVVRHVLQAMVGRTRDVESQIRQREKLASLGKLAGGLAHELNNPAAAMARAASSLREAIGDMQELIATNGGHGSEESRGAVQELLQRASDALPARDALALLNSEEALASVLLSLGCDKAWERAACLARAGLSADAIEQLSKRVSTPSLASAVTWAEMVFRIDDLGHSIESCARRMADILEAMKIYTFMDRAPEQELDVHEGLDATLRVFVQRIGDHIKVIRDYDRTLPKIYGNVGELNQVWTHLIDNALDAMPEGGRLTVRTARDVDGIVIEVGDTGIGISPDDLSRIFDPFFTTKDPGAGLGLGLDTARRILAKHGGLVHVSSKAGDTRFQVRLPFRTALRPVETAALA